jgi:dihydrofolate synthase/folylpolyglutamate synthase
MATESLDAWLTRIEKLHPREIDLSLDRVGVVLARLGMVPPPFRVITVGGTNGKGSVVEMTQHALVRAGIVTGAYTSPHLLRYNERMRVGGCPLDDEQILRGIDIVEEVRGDVPLTYFEFTTLAALSAFRDLGVQVAVMEVGLGGRLDAVNALDADVSAVCSIDLDHQEWLGSDREAIGFEKAGIFRPGRPAVIGDPAPPGSLIDHGRRIGASVLCLGKDFSIRPEGQSLLYLSPGGREYRVPRTPLTGDLEGQNTAVALTVLEALDEEGVMAPDRLGEAFGSATLAGRFQRFTDSNGALWVLDVAHNSAAIANLARKLDEQRGIKRWRVVLAMLKDKDAERSAAHLAQRVASWYLAPLSGQRGQSGEELAARINGLVPGGVRACASLPEALELARSESAQGEGVLVLGSFQVVGPALEFIRLYFGR